jgi:hypothetical protein
MIVVRLLLSLFAIILISAGVTILRDYFTWNGMVVRYAGREPMIIVRDDLFYKAIGYFAASSALIIFVLVSWAVSKRTKRKTLRPDPPAPPEFNDIGT